MCERFILIKNLSFTDNYLSCCVKIVILVSMEHFWAIANERGKFLAFTPKPSRTGRIYFGLNL